MIRPCTAADHEWICATAADVYRDLGDYGPIIASWLDHAGVLVFVDESDDGAVRRGFTLVGFYTPQDAIANGPDEVCAADLLAIAVAGEHQRQGIGRALLRHAIGVARTAARERRVPEMRLTVAEGNAVARALFEQHGFVVFDRDYGRYDGGQPALRMQLIL